MNLNLRRWGLWVGCFLIFASESRAAIRLPLLQTYTDPTSTRIIIMAPDALTPNRIQVTGPFLHSPPTWSVVRHKNPYTGGEIAHVDVTEMQAGHRYHIRVLASDLRSTLERREFRGLSLDAKKLKVTLASCMYDKFYKPKLWKRFNAESPDAILFLGDNVYANKPLKIADERQLWMRYTQTREKFSFFYEHKLTPSFSTWDDHDIGVNNGGRAYPLLGTARRIFDIFFGNPLSGQKSFSKGPGLSYIWKTPLGLWVVFDNRSFRDDPSPTSPGAYLGRTQLKWFADLIRQNPKAHLFLAGGSKFFEQELDHQEGYEKDYPAEFSQFLNLLRRHDGRATFLSGDRHYSEISDVLPNYTGYPTFEITSSAMHSYTAPFMLGINKNKFRITATASENFVVLDLLKKNGRLEASAVSRGEKRDLFVWRSSL
jgi:alkaline phosphatase D